MSKARAEDDPVIIKKYANRRLYNTDTSTYVTLDDLAEMVRQERDFTVRDAKTGDDLTHSVLTQIIVDQEARGQNLLPVGFLRQLIRFYGNSIEKLVPSYLELSLDNLVREQDRFARQFTDALGMPGLSAGSTLPGMEAVQEQTQRNMAMFEQAMEMFNPFAIHEGTVSTKNGQAKKPAKKRARNSSKSGNDKDRGDGDYDALRDQLAAMQAQLDKLAKGS